MIENIYRFHYFSLSLALIQEKKKKSPIYIKGEINPIAGLFLSYSKTDKSLWSKYWMCVITYFLLKTL